MNMRRSLSKLQTVNHGFMGCSMKDIEHYTDPKTLERKLILGYHLCDFEGKKERSLICLNGHLRDFQQIHIEKVVEKNLILICMDKNVYVVFCDDWTVKTIQYVWGLRRMRSIRKILFLRGYEEFLMIGFGSNTAQKYVVRSARMNINRINHRSRYLSQSRHYGFDVIYEHPNNSEPISSLYQLRKFENQIVIGGGEIIIYDCLKCVKLGEFRQISDEKHENLPCIQCISSYINSKSNHELVIAGSPLGVFVVDVDSKEMIRHLLPKTKIHSLIRIDESEFVLGGYETHLINFEDSDDEILKSNIIGKSTEISTISEERNEIITSFCKIEESKSGVMVVAGTNENRFQFYSLKVDTDIKERTQFLIEYIHLQKEKMIREKSNGLETSHFCFGFALGGVSEDNPTFFLYKSFLHYSL